MALILFAMAVGVALLLFVGALAVWLGKAMASFEGAMLLIGATFAAMAWLIYRLRLRDTLRKVDDRLQTIYEVAEGVKKVADWALGWLARGFDR